MLRYIHTYGPSPDLNPIGVHLKERHWKCCPRLVNVSGDAGAITPELADAIIHCWEILDPSICDRPARSMSRRITAAIEAKG